jgi:hypothetical protein
MKALDGESHSMKAALIAETEDLKRVENECLLKLEEVFDAQVIAQETLYKGVRIHFGRSVYEPDGTNTRAKVVYDKEQRRIDVCRL